MIIATLNIDWAHKSKTHKAKIENELNNFAFDILVLTEAVGLELPVYPFVYKTKTLPADGKYEEIEYGTFLENIPGYRVMIYSKYAAVRSFDVCNPFTSICCAFETDAGPLTVYATIVGTQFKKQPYATTELENCIKDCMAIAKTTDNFCLAGDLNTSFGADEKYFQMSNETTKQLRELCRVCDLDLTTASLKENIDHIFLPVSLWAKIKEEPRIFINKNVLSDHQGVVVEILDNSLLP